MRYRPRMHRVAALLVIGLVGFDARAETEGRLVASTTKFGSVGPDDMLYIHRIDDSAVTELHHETVASKPKLVWSDARTLWVLTEKLAPYKAKVQKFVDGKEVDSASLTPSDWKAPGLITQVLLRRTKSGEVWIETCVRGTHSPSIGRAARCREMGYLRLDTKPFAFAKKRPAFRDSTPTSPTGRQQLGDKLVAKFFARSLDDMHNDPKPYDGLWKIERNAKNIGEIPGEQMLLAPR